MLLLNLGRPTLTLVVVGQPTSTSSTQNLQQAAFYGVLYGLGTTPPNSYDSDSDAATTSGANDATSTMREDDKWCKHGEYACLPTPGVLPEGTAVLTFERTHVGAFYGLGPFAVRTKGDVVHAPAPLVAPDTGDVFDAVEVHSAASDGLAFLAPAAPPTINGAFDAAAMPTPPEAQAGAPPAYVVSAAARANLASARIVAHAHCGRGTTRADAHAVALVPGKGLRLLHITSTLNAEDALGDSAPVHATDVGSAMPEPRHAACDAIAAGIMACDAASASAVFVCQPTFGRTPRSAIPYAVHVNTASSQIVGATALRRPSRGNANDNAREHVSPPDSTPTQRWPVAVAMHAGDPGAIYGIFHAAPAPAPATSGKRPPPFSRGMRLLLEAGRVDGTTRRYVALTPVFADAAHVSFAAPSRLGTVFAFRDSMGSSLPAPLLQNPWWVRRNGGATIVDVLPLQSPGSPAASPPPVGYTWQRRHPRDRIGFGLVRPYAHARPVDATTDVLSGGRDAHAEAPARFVQGFPRVRRIGGFGFDIELSATAPCEVVIALYPGAAYAQSPQQQRSRRAQASFYGMMLGLEDVDEASGEKDRSSSQTSAVEPDDAAAIAWNLVHALRHDRAEPRSTRYLDEPPVRAPVSASPESLYGINAQEWLPYHLYSRRLMHLPSHAMAAYAMRVSSLAALGDHAEAVGISAVRLGAPLDPAEPAEQHAPIDRRAAESILRQAAYDAARGRLPTGSLAPETDYLVCAVIVDADAAATPDEEPMPYADRAATCVRTSTSRMHTDSALGSLRVQSRANGCHPERHALYRGVSVLIESALRVPTAAHCCALCHDHARVSLRTGRLPCNVWSFCDPANALIPGSSCTTSSREFKQGHCWLKHAPRPSERDVLVSGPRIAWTSGYLALGARHSAVMGNRTTLERSFTPGALVDGVGSSDEKEDLLTPRYEMAHVAHCTPTCPIGRAYRPYSRALPNSHFHLESHIFALRAHRKVYSATLPSSAGYAVVMIEPRAIWSHVSVNGVLFPCCLPIRLRVPWVPFVSPSALAADSPWLVDSARTTQPHLSMPRHTLLVNVTAEDGVGWTAYTVSLSQERSSEARLGNLYVRGIEMRRATGEKPTTVRAPIFDPDIMKYEANVPFETKSVGIFAHALDPRRRSVRIDALSLSTRDGRAHKRATHDIREAEDAEDAALEVRTSLTGSNSRGVELDYRAVRYPGPTEASISLAVGPNRIVVETIAQDGTTTRLYELHISRGAPSTDASLASLSLWRALGLGTGLGETSQRLLLAGGSLGRTNTGDVQRLAKPLESVARGVLCSAEAAHVQVDLDATFINAVLQANPSWPRADTARGFSANVTQPVFPSADQWRTAAVPALEWRIEVSGAPVFVGLSEGTSVPRHMPLPTRKLVPMDTSSTPLVARFADCDVAMPPIRGRRYFATLLGDFACMSPESAVGEDAGGAALLSFEHGRTHDARFLGGASSATSGQRCTPACANYEIRVAPFRAEKCNSTASDLGNPALDSGLPAPAFARLGAAGHGGATDLLTRMPSAPRWLHVPLTPRFNAVRDATVPPRDTPDSTDPADRFHAIVNYTAQVPSYVSELLVTALVNAPSKVTNATLYHFDSHASALGVDWGYPSRVFATMMKGGHDILPYSSGIVVTTSIARQPIALESNRTLVLSVVAQDPRYRRTYIIRSTRERQSSNAFLSSLRIESQPGHHELPLSPAFNGTATFIYEVDYLMDADTREFRVTPVAAHGRYRSIHVNQYLVASGETSPPFDLGFGEHSVAITVTAEDGLHKQTYHVYLRKKPLSPDDTLLSLVLHEAEGGVLVPPFSPHMLRYDAYVAHDTPHGTLTPVATSKHYTAITVDAVAFPSGMVLTPAFNTTSGSLSGPLELDATHFQGMLATTLITVNVTAQDVGHMRRYQIYVHRAAAPVTVHEDRLSRLACFQFDVLADSTTTRPVVIRMEPPKFSPDVMHYELFPEVALLYHSETHDYAYSNATKVVCEMQTYDSYAYSVDVNRIFHVVGHDHLRRAWNTTQFSFRQLVDEYASFLTIRVRAGDERFRNTYKSVEMAIKPSMRTYRLLFTNYKQPRVRLTEDRWRGTFEPDGDGLTADTQPTQPYAGESVSPQSYIVETRLAGIVGSAIVQSDRGANLASTSATSGALVQAVPDIDAVTSAERRREESPLAIDPRAYPVSLPTSAIGLPALRKLSAYQITPYDGDLPTLGGGSNLPLCGSWLCLNSPYDVSVSSFELVALGHVERDATAVSEDADPVVLATKAHISSDGRYTFGSFGSFKGRPGGLPAALSTSHVEVRTDNLADAFHPTIIVKSSAPAALALILDLSDRSTRKHALVVGTLDTATASWEPLRDFEAVFETRERFQSATFESRRHFPNNDGWAATETMRRGREGTHERSAQRPAASSPPRIVEYYVNGVLMDDHVAFARARLGPELDGHYPRSLHAHVRLHPRLLHAAASSLRGPLVYGNVGSDGRPVNASRYGRILLFADVDPRSWTSLPDRGESHDSHHVLHLRPPFSNTTRTYATHRAATSHESHVAIRVLTRSQNVRCIVQNRRFRANGTFFRVDTTADEVLPNATLHVHLQGRNHTAIAPLVFGRQRIEVVVISNADSTLRWTYGVDVVRSYGNDTTLASLALLREPIAPLAHTRVNALRLNVRQHAQSRISIFADDGSAGSCDDMQSWGPLGPPKPSQEKGFPRYAGRGHDLCWPNARLIRLQDQRTKMNARHDTEMPSFYGVQGLQRSEDSFAVPSSLVNFYGFEGLGDSRASLDANANMPPSLCDSVPHPPVFLDHMSLHVLPKYAHTDAFADIFVDGSQGNASVYAQDVPYNGERVVIVARATAGPRGDVPGESQFMLYAREPGGKDVPCVDAYHHRASNEVRFPTGNHEPSARCVTRGVEPLAGTAEETFCLPYVWLCYHDIPSMLPRLEETRSVHYTLRDLHSDPAVRNDAFYEVMYTRMPPPGYQKPDMFYGLTLGLQQAQDDATPPREAMSTFYGMTVDSFYGIPANESPDSPPTFQNDLSLGGFSRFIRRYVARVDYRQRQAALSGTPFDARARGVAFSSANIIAASSGAFAAPTRSDAGFRDVPPIATPHAHVKRATESLIDHVASGPNTGLHAGLAYDGASRTSAHVRRSDHSPSDADPRGDDSANLLDPAYRSYASPALPLTVGVTRLSAAVAAHASQKSGEYTVDVIRLPSRDATLSRLVVSASDAAGLPTLLNYSHINPHPFDPRILNYTLVLPPHVFSVSVLSEPNDPRHYSLTVAGNPSGAAQNSPRVDLPGCASLKGAAPWQASRIPNDAFNCVVPPFDIPIRVVAEDGVTALTYTLTVLRGEGPIWGREAGLTHLDVGVAGAPLDLSPSFRAYRFGYRAVLPRDAWNANATISATFQVANRGVFAVLVNGQLARAIQRSACSDGASGRVVAAFEAKFGLRELASEHSSRIEIVIKPFNRTDPRSLGGEEPADSENLATMPPVYFYKLFRKYTVGISFGPPVPFSSSARQPSPAGGLAPLLEPPPHASQVDSYFPMAPGHALRASRGNDVVPAWKVRPRAEEGVGVLDLATKIATLDADMPQFARTCDGGKPRAAELDWRGEQSFGVAASPAVSAATQLTARVPVRSGEFVLVPSWAHHILRVPSTPAVELVSIAPKSTANPDSAVRIATDTGGFGIAEPLEAPPCPAYPFIANAYYDVSRGMSGAQISVRASEPAVAYYAVFEVHDERHSPRPPTPRELVEHSRGDALITGVLGEEQGLERWLLVEGRARLKRLKAGALYHVWVILEDRAHDLTLDIARNLQVAPTRIAHVACDASTCRYRDDPAVLLTPRGSLRFACECVNEVTFYGLQLDDMLGGLGDAVRKGVDDDADVPLGVFYGRNVGGF